MRSSSLRGYVLPSVKGLQRNVNLSLAMYLSDKYVAKFIQIFWLIVFTLGIYADSLGLAFMLIAFTLGIYASAL